MRKKPPDRPPDREPERDPDQIETPNRAAVRSRTPLPTGSRRTPVSLADEAPTARQRQGDSEPTGPTAVPGIEDQDTDEIVSEDESDSGDSYLFASHLTPKALARLALNLKELNQSQRRSLAVVEEALIAKTLRDQARAALLNAIRESVVYVVRSPYSATVIAVGVVLVLLQLSGVNVELAPILKTVETIAGQCEIPLPVPIAP
jgi:hypothetical protein